MSQIRRVVKSWKSKPTIEGAGVRLKRAFGYFEVPSFDPFLLLDDFHSRNPEDYIAGFPWHPHRGIETVTYMLSGEVAHGDSMGNSGVIGSGDCQWMTAGSGIIHQEMPQRQEGELQGFQLWVNLPAASKMMEPRYRDIQREKVPAVEAGDGVTVKVICGEVNGVKGPVKDIIVDPEYLDVRLEPEALFSRRFNQEYRVVVYIINGEAAFDPDTDETSGAENLILFGDGDEVRIRSGEAGARFLLISGKPIGEPVAWRGPIVMNTHEELAVAFEEYYNGTFIKFAG